MTENGKTLPSIRCQIILKSGQTLTFLTYMTRAEFIAVMQDDVIEIKTNSQEVMAKGNEPIGILTNEVLRVKQSEVAVFLVMDVKEPPKVLGAHVGIIRPNN